VDNLWITCGYRHIFRVLSSKEISEPFLKKRVGGSGGKGCFKDLDIIEAPRYNDATLISRRVKLKI